MKNNEIRKKAISELTRYWVEAEFLFLTVLCSAALYIIIAYIAVLLLYPDADALIYPVGPGQLVELLKKHNEAAAVISGIAFPAFIFLNPLMYGVKWCYFQAAQGKQAPVSGAFFGYYTVRRWFKTVVLSAYILLRKIKYLIPAGAICTAAYFLAADIAKNKPPNVTFWIYAGYGIILVAVYIIYMTLTVKYDLIPYIFSEQAEKSIFDIYRTGVSAMKGETARYARLKLWFMPLLLLCLSGFPAMAIIPIYSMTKSIGLALIYSGKFEE